MANNEAKLVVFDSHSRKLNVVNVTPEGVLCIYPWPISNDVDFYDVSVSCNYYAVFLHRNDFFSHEKDGMVKRNSANAGSKAWQIVGNANVVVGYTGADSGLVSDDFRRDAELTGFDASKLSSWYAVNKKIEHVTDSEMRELVEWTLDPNRDNEQLPVVIRPMRLGEYGVSLSILCQGFLAQYALLQGDRLVGSINSNGNIRVGEALKEMGWVNDEVTMTELQIVTELSSSHTGTSLPNGKYWNSPFERLGKSLRQVLVEECSKLRAKVIGKFEERKLTWSDNSALPHSTNELVDTIIKSDVSGDGFVRVVAESYLELNILLEAV